MAKRYEELTFNDDFMFCKILEQNPTLCREDSRIELGDETEKIFLCAKGTVHDVSDKLQAFLDYIASGKPSDGFTNELENEVKKARDHIKWRTEYMTFLEQLERERIEARAEGLAEGREEGLKQGRAEGLKEGRAEGLKEDRAEGRAEGLEQGRTEERANTEFEKARADAAEKRADALSKEILELKKRLESLKQK